jgi:hypothetical protein
MHPIPQMPPPRRPRKANGCLITAGVAGGFVVLLLFGGCTAALVANPSGATDPPSATPTSSAAPTGTTSATGTGSPSATPAATRTAPAHHRRHTAHPKRPHPRPTPVHTHARHHVTHKPKPRPTHAPPRPHRLTVTPGAFCAHTEAGHVGVSSAGRTYVCRTDDAGRLRWRRP